MAFIEMDPEIALKAIEGYQNELAVEQSKLDVFYRQFTCVKCGGTCRKEIANASHAFPKNSEWLVARSVLRCINCRCLFDPHTNILLEPGGPPNVPAEIPIIGQTRY